MKSKIITKSVVLAITVLILSLMIRSQNQAFFEKTHFDQWNLSYPTVEKELEFISERAFGNDHFDYIIFPRNQELENEIKQYAKSNADFITSHGNISDSTSPNSKDIPIFFDNIDDYLLEERINTYSELTYWTYNRVFSDTLGIVISDRDIIFIFIKI